MHMQVGIEGANSHITEELIIFDGDTLESDALSAAGAGKSIEGTVLKLFGSGVLFSVQLASIPFPLEGSGIWACEGMGADGEPSVWAGDYEQVAISTVVIEDLVCHLID